MRLTDQFLLCTLLLLLTSVCAGQVMAQTFFDNPRSFVVTTTCDAHSSIRNQTDPVALTVDQAYLALGENKPAAASHSFIEVQGQRKWVDLDCGRYEDAPAAVCLAFFDNLDNPEDIPGSGLVDATPPPPQVFEFGRAVNDVCGAPGKRVSPSEFATLFTEHPDVLASVRSFTSERVFADRQPPATEQEYLADLTDAWFSIHGFDHIFCGEPRAGGGIGGFHFRGRYLQLQQQGLACRLSNNRHNEEIVPGSIYTIGVSIKMNGDQATQAVKGYGLTLSAEDLFKVVTRAFAENPTTSSSSVGCTLTVEDDGERFASIFVRRRQGIRTFFPDATPDRNRNPDCTSPIVVPPVSGQNSAPEVARPLSVRTLASGADTNLPVPPDTFKDPDNDRLSLSASLENGAPLPAWVEFDADRSLLIFRPQQSEIGKRLTVVITASDGQAQITDTVTVEVVAPQGCLPCPP